MNKKYIFLIIGGVIFLAVIAIYFVFLQDHGQPTQAYQSKSTTNSLSSSPAVTPTPVVMTPEQVVNTFYLQYLSYQPSPYKSGLYRSNTYLTDDFKQNVAKMRAGDANNDPILCYFNKTKNFSIDAAQFNAAQTTADVVMHRSDGKKIFRFALIKLNGAWIINDTFCIPTSGQ